MTDVAQRTAEEPRPPATTGRRIAKNLRWWILGWLLAAGIINYMDRSSVAIAAPELIREFGLTKTDIGLMGTVFSWTYAFCQLPVGWIVDRVGARKIYFLALSCWSIATTLMATGSHLWQFLTFRFLLGIGESPNSPVSAKVTASWFPRAERGQATGVWDSGSKWGPAIAPPILTALMIAFGWRAMFVVLGVAGLVLAVAFLLWYKSPEDSKRLSDEEYAHILTGRDRTDGPRQHIPWLSLFKYRQVWGMMGGFFCNIWIWNIFIIFLPLYLQERLGVTILGSGLFAAIPYVGAAVCGIYGGYLTKVVALRYDVSPLVAKRRVAAVVSVGSGVLVCIIPFVANLALAMVVMTFALGMIATMQCTAWSLPGDIVPDSHVASVGAIQNFGGYFGGAFAPLLTGFLADKTGSYTLAFLIAGVIAALGAVAYWTLVRRPIAQQDAVPTAVGEPRGQA